MNRDQCVTPIGIVCCSARSRQDVRRGGDRCVVRIFPEFQEGLALLEHNSHIILLGWFHQADRTVLRTRPRKVAPFAEERGVFAGRSPDRPTPVAVTVVPLLERRGGDLEVDGLDFVDGTPIIDIKPYCPGWDSVFSAVHRRRADPSLQPDDILKEFYARDFVNHLGRNFGKTNLESLSLEACLMATRHLKCDPRNGDLKIILHRISPMMDGIMAITGACISNGRLEIRNDMPPASLDSLKGERIDFVLGSGTLSLESSDGKTWNVL